MLVFLQKIKFGHEKKKDISQKFCINPFFTSAASYFLQVFKSLVFHPNQTCPVTSHQGTPTTPNLSGSQPAQPYTISQPHRVTNQADHARFGQFATETGQTPQFGGKRGWCGQLLIWQ